MGIVLASTAAGAGDFARAWEDDAAAVSSRTSPSSEGSERRLNCALSRAEREWDGGCVGVAGSRPWGGRSGTALVRGRLLRSESPVVALRLNPGVGELEREAGGDGGNSGAGGAGRLESILWTTAC